MGFEGELYVEVMGDTVYRDIFPRVMGSRWLIYDVVGGIEVYTTQKR